MAELLDELTRTRWYRWRGRAPSWRVLHSVPLLDARGRGRGDIDHVLIGPPGVVTVTGLRQPAWIDGERAWLDRAGLIETAWEQRRPALAEAFGPEVRGADPPCRQR